MQHELFVGIQPWTRIGDQYGLAVVYEQRGDTVRVPLVPGFPDTDSDLFEDWERQRKNLVSSALNEITGSESEEHFYRRLLKVLGAYEACREVLKDAGGKRFAVEPYPI